MKRTVVVLMAGLFLALPAGPSSGAMPIEPEDMLATVRSLSGAELRGRGLGTAELDQAAALIASRFAALGLMPGGTKNDSWYQEWYDPELKMRLRNVVGILPGRNPQYAGQSVVIGAHYDGLGMGMFGARREDQGKVHPGADDNASGVAVLIELASRLPLTANIERSVVFVAFTGEEAGRKGSRYYVEHERRYPAGRATGMINLDTVGRLGRGKLILLGAGSAEEWAPLFQEAGKAAKVEIAPSLQELDSSDQVSFHAAGVPAVQLFTGAHLDYHRPTDTFDEIDAKGMVKVATVARDVAFYLSNHPAPLTTKAGPVRTAPDAGARGDRKVTLGIVPDFTYNGTGVRLGGTVPQGPAEQAGMKQGDVIVSVGQVPIAVLKDLSEAIRAASPGDRLTVNFLREGKEYRTTVEVREK
jgi:hypothetical protein